MVKHIQNKPGKGRNYVKTDNQMLNEAEDDQNFKIEAAMADQDYSVQSEVELSDEEFLKRARVSLTSNILPKPPAIAGYHTCWIPQQTNNTYDTIEYRKNVGYSVVKPEDVPQFMSSSNRSGSIDGCVSHMELILMKLPLRLYNLLMREVHHIQPNDQERVIKQNIAQMADNEGNNIARDEHEMTGIRNLARKVNEPNFINS
jgi:hypothetical protein